MAKVDITKKEIQKQMNGKKKKKKPVKVEQAKPVSVPKEKVEKLENTKKSVPVQSAKAVKVKKTVKVEKAKKIAVQTKKETNKVEQKVPEKQVEIQSAKAVKVKKKVKIKNAKAIKIDTELRTKIEAYRKAKAIVTEDSIEIIEKKKKRKKKKERQAELSAQKKETQQIGAKTIKVPVKPKMEGARVLKGKVNKNSFEIVREVKVDPVVAAARDLKTFIQTGEREVEEVEVERSGSLLAKLFGSALIIAGAVAIGVMLYRPIDIEATEKPVKYRYGEWEAEQVRFCLVSPDGKYFENDHVKYEFDEARDTCTKLTRVRTLE